MMLPRSVVRKTFPVTRSLRGELGSTILWKHTTVVFVIFQGSSRSLTAIVTTDSSSNYFSLASKHFNTTSATNSFSIFSFPCQPFRASFRLLSPLQPPSPLPIGHRFSMCTGPNRTAPQPQTRTPSSHYFNCASSNNSPR